MTGREEITLGDIHDELKQLAGTLNAYMQAQAPIIAVIDHRLTEAEGDIKAHRRENTERIAAVEREIGERVAGLDQSVTARFQDLEHERKALAEQARVNARHRMQLWWGLGGSIGGSVVLVLLTWLTHIHP